MKTKITLITALLLPLCFFGQNIFPSFTLPALFTTPNAVIAFSTTKLWPLIPLLMVGVIILMARNSNEEQDS